VKISPPSVVLRSGERIRFRVEAFDAAGRAIDVESLDVEYRTSNALVMALLGGGNALALAPGQATVTATVSGKSASAAVTVQGGRNGTEP
jgi:hypothetical protein